MIVYTIRYAYQKSNSMLKKILIISGITALSLLLLAWVYLLLFGVPNVAQQTFTDLGIVSSTEITPVTENTATQLAPDTKLQQLTVRPVAGFVYLTEPISTTTASSTVGDIKQILRYVERGTGYVYEIDLNNGTETKVSGLTVSQTVTANFSPDGNQVVLITEDGSLRSTQLLGLVGTSTSKTLPYNATNFGWSNNDILNYTIGSASSTTAYSHESGLAGMKWRIPLTNVDVYWRNLGDIIINKPAPNLKSGIFRVSKNNLIALVPPRYALFGFPNQAGNLIFYSYFDTQGKEMSSALYNITDGSEYATAITSIPEKCGFDSTNTKIWCGFDEANAVDREDINHWYRGEIKHNDNIWVTEVGSPEEAILATTLSSQTGYSIDVTDLKVTRDNQYLIFRNKNNDTLWKYSLE